MSDTLFNPDRMPPRDAYGHHFHPDLDQFSDGDEGPMRRADLQAADWELSWLYLENDVSADAINDRCAEGDPNVSDWNPEREGWYRAGIWDTEDGPIAAFVRPVVQP